MKASDPLLSPALMSAVLAKGRKAKVAAAKAKETKRRRYEVTSVWIHPLGDLFHGVDRSCL